MPELSMLWQFIPDPLRPFVLPALICFYLYFFVSGKRSEARQVADSWAVQNTAGLRADNDRQTARITDLEQALAQLRERYEDILDGLRANLDRGWDLARDWCSIAHDQRHWINNKLMLIPEKYRPDPLPPLPNIERRPGLRPESFPDRFGTTEQAPLPPKGDSDVEPL